MDVVSSSPVIRVLVVDDDALVRSVLVMILGGAPDIEVVGQAVDGRAGLDAVREHRPDVVLRTSGCPGSTAWRPPSSSARGRTRPR
jgi:DNA-binding NarL/FixJ family response regulator